MSFIKSIFSLIISTFSLNILTATKKKKLFSQVLVVSIPKWFVNSMWDFDHGFTFLKCSIVGIKRDIFSYI